MLTHWNPASVRIFALLRDRFSTAGNVQVRCPDDQALVWVLLEMPQQVVCHLRVALIPERLNLALIRPLVAKLCS